MQAGDVAAGDDPAILRRIRKNATARAHRLFGVEIECHADARISRLQRGEMQRIADDDQNLVHG